MKRFRFTEEHIVRILKEVDWSSQDLVDKV
jgi:hypothetical protein